MTVNGHTWVKICVKYMSLLAIISVCTSQLATAYLKWSLPYTVEPCYLKMSGWGNVVKSSTHFPAFVWGLKLITSRIFVQSGQHIYIFSYIFVLLMKISQLKHQYININIKYKQANDVGQVFAFHRKCHIFILFQLLYAYQRLKWCGCSVTSCYYPMMQWQGQTTTEKYCLFQLILLQKYF